MAFNKLKNWIAHIYLLPFLKIFPRMNLRRDIVEKDSSLAEKIILSLFPTNEKVKLGLVKRLIADNEFISHELILHYKPESEEKQINLLKELIDDNENIFIPIVNHYTNKNSHLKEKVTQEYLTDNKEQRRNIVFSWINKDVSIQQKLNADYTVGTRITQGRIEKAVYYKEEQKIEISGYYLPISAYDTVEIYSNEQHLGTAEMGIVKQNIFEEFPAYNTKNSGWKFVKKIDMLELPENICIVLKKDEKKIYQDIRKIIVSMTEEKKSVGRFGININSVNHPSLDVYKRVQQFNFICSSLNTWMPWENEIFQKKFIEKKHDITHGKEPIERLFIDIFSKGNCFYFKNAQVQYQNADKFWIIINELLIQQEYYFETDEEEPFIIDGGANIGLAIFYFKTLYPHAKIIAFEPSINAYEILKKNTENNHWENVTLLPYALDITEQTSELIVPNHDCLGASLTKRALEYQSGTVHMETIKTKRLNTYINHKVDFLKLDVEGVEVRILRELAEKLNCVQHLFCEYHFGNLVTDNNLDELIDILSKYGFQYQLSKSPSYQRATGTQTMKYVGERYSLNIWAKKL